MTVEGEERLINAETIRTVREGDISCTEVGPDRDGFGMVEMRKKSGNSVFNRTVFSVQKARLVAQALLDCADEIEAVENKTTVAFIRRRAMMAELGVRGDNG